MQETFAALTAPLSLGRCSSPGFVFRIEALDGTGKVVAAEDLEGFGPAQASRNRARPDSNPAGPEHETTSAARELVVVTKAADGRRFSVELRHGRVVRQNLGGLTSPF